MIRSKASNQLQKQCRKFHYYKAVFCARKYKILQIITSHCWYKSYFMCSNLMGCSLLSQLHNNEHSKVMLKICSHLHHMWSPWMTNWRKWWRNYKFFTKNMNFDSKQNICSRGKNFFFLSSQPSNTRAKKPVLKQQCSWQHCHIQYHYLQLCASVWHGDAVPLALAYKKNTQTLLIQPRFAFCKRLNQH